MVEMSQGVTLLLSCKSSFPSSLQEEGDVVRGLGKYKGGN